MMLLVVASFLIVVGSAEKVSPPHVSLGPRPFWLLNEMRPNKVKDTLGKCNGSSCWKGITKSCLVAIQLVLLLVSHALLP